MGGCRGSFNFYTLVGVMNQRVDGGWYKYGSRSSDDNVP